jgi:hypothetical protein
MADFFAHLMKKQWANTMTKGYKKYPVVAAFRRLEIKAIIN